MRRLLQGALAAVTLTACSGAREVNPEEVYLATFNMPRNEIEELRGGGVAWQGHDVWLTFKSSSRPTLKARIDLHAPSPRELQDIERRLGPCAALERQPGAQVQYYSDMRKGYDNGEVVIYHAATSRVCYRGWAHK